MVRRAHRADACLKDALELTAAAADRLLHHALDHLDCHIHPRRKIVGAAPEDERVGPPHGARRDAQRVPPARARVRQRRQQRLRRAFLGASHTHRQRQRHVREAQRQQQQLRRGLRCAFHRRRHEQRAAQLRHLRRRQRRVLGRRRAHAAQQERTVGSRRAVDDGATSDEAHLRRDGAAAARVATRIAASAASLMPRGAHPVGASVALRGLRTRERRQKLDGAAAGAAEAGDVADLQLAEAVVPDAAAAEAERDACPRQLRERRLGVRRREELRRARVAAHVEHHLVERPERRRVVRPVPVGRRHALDSAARHRAIVRQHALAAPPVEVVVVVGAGRVGRLEQFLDWVVALRVDPVRRRRARRRRYCRETHGVRAEERATPRP